MSEYVHALTPSLFWDVDRKKVDDEKHRRFIISRVLERGSMEDWRRTRSRYGLSVVVQEAQKMRSLDLKALSFVACVGGVAKETFRCYSLRHLHQAHWSF